MTAVKSNKNRCVLRNRVSVRRTHLYFGVPVRLLLLLLLGFIGVAGHAGNFELTTTNYEDMRQSPFTGSPELEFHTEKLFEQSNFSFTKDTTGPQPHHEHLSSSQDEHRYASEKSQSNSSLRRGSQTAKMKTTKKNSPVPKKVKGQKFSGGHDFPEDHEFPGGHDFHQGHRSHHSEPLAMAHRLDDEFNKESKSVPVVPIQLPPPNDTIHYHYTDDEDSEFYSFSQMSPSSSFSSSMPFKRRPFANSNQTANPRKNTLLRPSLILSKPFIEFDTYEDDDMEVREEKTSSSNSLSTIRASTKSKSKLASQQAKNAKDSRKRNTAGSPTDPDMSSSETAPRRHPPSSRASPKKLKKTGSSQSKFYGNDPKILYDESPFHLSQNSRSHDDDDQSKQYNYYVTKNKKGNELRNLPDDSDDDREFQLKTRPTIKQRVITSDERDKIIGDSLDLDHDPRQKLDKHFEKSGDENKHVEEVADFESKKISKISQNNSSKPFKGLKLSKPDKKAVFQGNRAMSIPSSNTNATSNSLEDLENDFDYESQDDEKDSGSLMRRRPRRSVVHLYDMVVCATGCNPLAYKGYGCYCGFLGSGLTVDGIDRCCAKHDWCYHHAKCPPLLTYFVPYYWTCNAGRPKCVTDYRGWKGICGANLCECDRQFAECLRKFPCPRSRAMCMTSPWRFWQNLLMTPPMRYGYDY